MKAAGVPMGDIDRYFGRTKGATLKVLTLRDNPEQREQRVVDQRERRQQAKEQRA